MSAWDDRDDATFSKVASVISGLFRVPAGRAIEPQTTSSDLEGWDSLSHAVLIMRIEEAFHVSLPFERVYESKNVGELVQLVRDTVGTTHA